MNFRRILARKLTVVVPVLVMAALVIALVAMPAGAITQTPAQPAGGEVLNSPGPLPAMINYQGQLTDSQGNPLSGTYDMEFQFWDSASGGSQVLFTWTIIKSGVEVLNGLFSVKLDVDQRDFNGQGLWLEVKVEGEVLSPRQELLPVPYALSLKPGARIEGDSSGPSLRVTNASYSGVGIYGENSFSGNNGSLGDFRWGVYGERGDKNNYGALGTSSEGVLGYGEVMGGHFVATGEEGRGIRAACTGANGYAADFMGNVLIRDGGIKIGNTSNAIAGTIRWTGSHFEGYTGTGWTTLDGVDWSSKTSYFAARSTNTNSYSAVVDVSGSGYLMSIQQYHMAIADYFGYLKIVIDGSTRYDSEFSKCSMGLDGYYSSPGMISGLFRFNSSLRVYHRSSYWIRTMVTYVKD